MFKIYTPLLLVFTILGCKQDSVVEESNDLNGDGVQDIHVEYKDGHYYSLYDRNFDSKIDESIKFDENYENAISATLDENFDGYPDTYIKYKYGAPSEVCTDSNKNGIKDIYFKYKSGVLDNAKRFYLNETTGNTTGSINYSFGYPSEEEIINTNMSEESFSQKYCNW